MSFCSAAATRLCNNRVDEQLICMKLEASLMLFGL